MLIYILKLFTICLSSMFPSQHIPSFISTHLFFVIHETPCLSYRGFQPPKRSCPPRWCLLPLPPWQKSRNRKSPGCLPDQDCWGCWMLVRLVLVNQRNEGSWLHLAPRFSVALQSVARKCCQAALYLTADGRQGLKQSSELILIARVCKPMRL